MPAKGFTLIELVMVMVITVTVSAVAFSRFNQSSFAIEASTGELIEALRYAQEMSMAHTGANDYVIAVNAGGFAVTQFGVAITNPIDGSAGYTSNWSGVTLSPTGSISFDGYGEPSLAGALAWSANQEVITVTQGGEARTVTVEEQTGFSR